MGRGRKGAGRYANGTALSLLFVDYDSKQWIQVSVNGVRGYMDAAGVLPFDQLSSMVWWLESGVVKEGDPVAVHAAPSDDAPVLGFLPANTTVEVTYTAGTWYAVRIGDHPVAYVPTNRLTVSAYSKNPRSHNGNATDTSAYAVVANPNPGDRLDLHEGPSASSATIARYFNGTQVEVLGFAGDKNEWAHVLAPGAGNLFEYMQEDDQTGYVLVEPLDPLSNEPIAQNLTVHDDAMIEIFLRTRAEHGECYTWPEDVRQAFDSALSDVGYKPGINAGIPTWNDMPERQAIDTVAALIRDAYGVSDEALARMPVSALFTIGNPHRPEWDIRFGPGEVDQGANAPASGYRVVIDSRSGWVMHVSSAGE